jgi:hypothetical protein
MSYKEEERTRACHMRLRMHTWRPGPKGVVMSYEEEDTCMSYEEEDAYLASRTQNTPSVHAAITAPNREIPVVCVCVGGGVGGCLGGWLAGWVVV